MIALMPDFFFVAPAAAPAFPQSLYHYSFAGRPARVESRGRLQA
jgi:hypothetical protein